MGGPRLLGLGLGLARHTHPAWLGRRVASRLSLPGTLRPLVHLSFPAQTDKAGARLPAAPSVPSPARGSPAPRVLLSVPTLALFP